MTRERGPLRRLQRRWKDGWIADPDGPGARRSKTIDMLLFDHGLLRKAWRNQHEVAPGVWRSSQPDPGMIRRLAAQGVKAIVNLRGATEWGSYFLEREACRAAGIELVDFKLNSRKLPSRDALLALDALFGRLPKPFLMHCKSGADRAGFAAALYLLLRSDMQCIRNGFGSRPNSASSAMSSSRLGSLRELSLKSTSSIPPTSMPTAASARPSGR